MDIKPIEWKGDRLIVLDQRLLPHKFEYVECKTYMDVYLAIKEMKTRGAPVIGVTAGYGFYLGIKELKEEEIKDRYTEIKDKLLSARPTAVNLRWALERMERVLKENLGKQNIKEIIRNEAIKIEKEEEGKCIKISQFGEKLFPDGTTFLTHCNTGSLATLGPGTALGVIKFTKRSGKRIQVFYTETRPYLQGARLTGLELVKEGIPSTLITDSMAGWVMKLKKVDAVIVGADRIARNGDTANKIGTYTLSVLARENGIPFYIAAPFSSIDLSLESGDKIPIEERNPKEVTHIKDIQIAVDGTKVFNPAFDVTPHENITAIITEKGVVYPPFEENLLKLSKS